MFKAMVFLKREPGLTREEFIAHYEGTHARLFQKHFPPIPDYRRNYPVWDDPLTFMGSFDNQNELSDNSLRYDCITEVWFEDRSGFENLYRLLSDPQLGRLVKADEETFLDRQSMRVLVVEEHRYEEHRKRAFS